MPLCIPDLLEQWATTTPDQAAIWALEREPLSYQQLFTHVRTVVEKLNALGIGPNDRVAIVLPNGPEMAVAFLAVAAGATSAPLNPAYRERDFDFYLSDLNAKALLISANLDSPARAVAAAQGIPIIELTPLIKAEAGLFDLEGTTGFSPIQHRFAQPENVAMVLHTSGTTSRPKIVPLTHINICTSARNICTTLALSQQDRCLNLMPLFHIHGLMGATLSSLSAGAGLVCTPGFDGSQFFDWLDHFHPTWYSAVPTMHQAILSEAADNQDAVSRSMLRLIRSSSSSLPPVVMAALEDLFQAPVIESYGMTEASHQMTSNLLPPGKRKAGSVGLPAGPDVSIMDETGNLLPLGETGEIVIRGANVTLGYENNPEANATAFSKGWFRTGDQGRMDDEGYLYITGRLKEMINRGGENIAPREIDEALLQHPDVMQAVAFAVPHATLGEDVAAAVILTPNGTSTITEVDLREYAFTKLTDFKVPSQIVIVEEIPKGPTGKLQRIGLADKLASTLQTHFVAPTNEIENNLAKIWADVLGIKQVGIHDNFFGSGGDSLMAARLLTQIETLLGETLPLVTIFRAPTVAQLSDLLSQKDPSAPVSSLAVDRPANPNSIRANVLVGLKNRLLQLLALYAPGFTTTRVYLHRMRGVEIGENVSIGTSSIIETGHPKLISIGDNVSIGIRTIIVAHYRGSSTIRNSYDDVSVRIENDVYIGAGAIVLPHVTIGQGAVVAAGSVVNRSVPAGVMVQGNPAQPVAQCGVPYTGSYEEFLRHLRPIDPDEFGRNR